MEQEEFNFPEEEPELQKDVEEIESKEHSKEDNEDSK